MLRYSIFTIDVEKDLHTLKLEGVDKGLSILDKLLSKHKIKATFFVTGEVLKLRKKIFLNLRNKGHEIALHGYSHKRFDSLSLREKEKEIKSSVELYKKIFRQAPKGFRAPQHSIDRQTLSLLEKYDFKYDSSKTPLNLMLLRHVFKRNSNKKEILSNFFSSQSPKRLNKSIIEIPRTSFFLSVGGFELKVYPKLINYLTLNMIRLIRLSPIFVMHSWDLINIPSKTNKICSSREFIKKLEEFIIYSKSKSDYLKMEDFKIR
jgi:hypothetical protein